MRYKTISANQAIIEKKWLVIDVEGMVLGRAAARIAYVLRGKHKPYFTPHADCGDNVIVINADKIRLTGNKLYDKQYVRYSGYPGGQRSVTANVLLSKHPERLLEHAIKGMLPKNKLGAEIFRNLRVYAGVEHPHAAQEPQAYQI
jgi:large subunit ribosomal protein L13